MSTSIEFVQGPKTSEVSRQVAEEGLRRHASVAAGAPYAIDQINGQWVAAIVHQAEFPPSAGPAEEDSTPPQSDGPDDGGSGDPSPSDGPSDSPDSGSDDSSSSDDKSKSDSKGGEHSEIKQLLEAVTNIAQALGIPLDPAGAGMGDPNDPMAGGDPSGGLGGPPPGAGGPPGLGGPGAGGPPAPGMPPHAGHGQQGEQRVIHEKALKPGETPAGATPAGAPAFSSVRHDHPWREAFQTVASFKTSAPIGDEPLESVQRELQSLAAEGGYRVARFGEGVDERTGQRIASAVITSH